MKAKKKSEIDIESFSKELLEYANANFSETMIFDTFKAKKDFGVKRNVIIEAFAFGPSDLKKFKLIESKPKAVIKEPELPCVGKKGTIVIKKFFLDAFNQNNPDHAYQESESFDIEISNEVITLKRKR